MVHSVQLPLQTEADGFVHGRMDDQGLSLLAQTMEHQVRPATCQPRLDVVVVAVAVAVVVVLLLLLGLVLVLVLLLLFSETSTCTTESQLRRQKYAS